VTTLKTETFDIGGEEFSAELVPDMGAPSPRQGGTFGILCLPEMDHIEDKSAPSVGGPDQFWRMLANCAAGRKLHAHEKEIEEDIKRRTTEALQGASSGSGGPSWDKTKELREEKEKRLRDVAHDLALTEYIVSGVYKYEHGRIKLSLGPFRSTWDSGQVGWIYARQSVAEDTLFSEDEDPTEEETRDKAYSTFEGELDVLSTWINSEVVGFRLFGPGGEKIDSCWGFYDRDYALDKARRSAEAHAEKLPA